MTFEEVIPALRNNQNITRHDLNGVIRLVKCPRNITRVRLIRNGESFPFKLSPKDILSDTWKIV